MGSRIFTSQGGSWWRLSLAHTRRPCSCGGLSKNKNLEDPQPPSLTQGMEYLAAVDVMILDVMADMNGNFQDGFKNTNVAMVELGLKTDTINQAIVDIDNRLQALEGQSGAVVEALELGEQAVTLGVRVYVSRGYIVITLLFFKHFAQQETTGYMLSYFVKKIAL